MYTKFVLNDKVIFLVILWFERGTSGPAGPPGRARSMLRESEPAMVSQGITLTARMGLNLGPAPQRNYLSRDSGALGTGLRFTSYISSDGKWRHNVSYVNVLAEKLGLKIGQELLLIQHNDITQGIPCVGRSSAEIKAELSKIKKCAEFIIIVAEDNMFKSITGFIGKRRPKMRKSTYIIASRRVSQKGDSEQPYRPDSVYKASRRVSQKGDSGQPYRPDSVLSRPNGPEGPPQSAIRVTVSWTSSGFTSSPQRKDTVFIQPYIYPAHYLKMESGNISFAALQDRAEWKFMKMSYFNFTSLLREGRLEVHSVFKAYEDSMFMFTNGGRVALLSEPVTQDGVPRQLFRDNTFIQHFIDPASQLWYYEPLSHRGKYIAYDISTMHFRLTDTASQDTWFRTMHVMTTTPAPALRPRPPPSPNGDTGPHETILSRTYWDFWSDECFI